MLNVIKWSTLMVLLQGVKYLGMYLFMNIAPSLIGMAIVVILFDIMMLVVNHIRMKAIEERRIRKVYGVLHL